MAYRIARELRKHSLPISFTSIQPTGTRILNRDLGENMPVFSSWQFLLNEKKLIWCQTSGRLQLAHIQEIICMAGFYSQNQKKTITHQSGNSGREGLGEIKLLISMRCIPLKL